MSTTPNFDPSKPQRAYLPNDWLAKEDWYIDEVSKISLPADPQPAHVRAVAIQIDRILTAARFDLAFMKQKYEEYNQIVDLLEKQMFANMKAAPPAHFSALKLTVDELKGIVVDTLLKEDFNKTGLNVYDLLKQSRNRYIFMDNTVRRLTELSGSLITHSGILKIENSLNSFIPSVPTAADMAGIQFPAHE